MNRKIQTSLSWKGKLSADGSVTISLGTFKFLTGNDTLKIWTYTPNGVLDSNTSNDTAKIVDTLLPSPQAIYSVTVFCGFVKYSASAASTSPTTISTYMWSGQGLPGYGPLIIKGQSGTYVFTRPGTYSYTLIVTCSRGCVTRYEDSVIVPDYVAVTLPADTIVCQKTSLLIKAVPSYGSPPYTYTWDHSSSMSQTLITTMLKDTVFVVHITDALNCRNYDSIKITSKPLADASFFVKYSGTTTYFHISDSTLKSYNYHWLFGDFVSGLAKDTSSGYLGIHLFTKIKIYTVKLLISGENGCMSELDTSIDILYAGISLINNKSSDLRIFPNPFQASTTINYNLTQP